MGLAWPWFLLLGGQPGTSESLETLHQLRQEEGKAAFDTVRGFFIEGRELYAGAGFRELDHIQICVRSLDQIVGFFWPRLGETK